MTNPNYDHVVLIVDKSGSMHKIQDDTEGGVNNFIHEQRASAVSIPGHHTTFSLYVFNSLIDRQFSFKDIERVKHAFALRPSGNTALYDAVGTAINETGDRLRDMPEDVRPGKVTIVIVTDGEENASRTYTYESIRSMISRQQSAYGWTFLFLAANQDAWRVGQGLGFHREFVMNYDDRSVGSTYGLASASVASARSTGTYTPLPDLAPVDTTAVTSQ